MFASSVNVGMYSGCTSNIKVTVEINGTLRASVVASRTISDPGWAFAYKCNSFDFDLHAGDVVTANAIDHVGTGGGYVALTMQT